MQGTTNGVVRKIKNISLDCVSIYFFGVLSVTDRSCFEMTEKRKTIWS